MTTEGQALTLALLIAAEQRFAADLEFATHDVIEKFFDMYEWPDERKADLYSRIVETIKVGDFIVTMQQSIALALRANQHWWQFGANRG